MYELGITTHFSAAHHLVAYPGACAVLHGHNWKIEVYVQGEELDELGMLVDFKRLKESVGEIIDELDHSDLNKHEAFQDLNPTSERIAEFIYKRLSAQAEGERYVISRIIVHETPGSKATYWE